MNNKFLFRASIALNIIALFFAVRRGVKEFESKPIVIKGLVQKSYSEKIEEFLTLLPVTKNDILFIGDSEISRFDTKKFFPGLPIKNFGIPGDNTTKVSKRIYEGLGTPKEIFIEVGTNDIYMKTPIDSSFLSLNKIISAIKTASPKSKIIVGSLLPISNFKRNSQQKIIDYNQRLKKTCDSARLSFVDLFTPLVDKNKLNKQFDCGDGVHLNKNGYEVFKRTIEPYL